MNAKETWQAALGELELYVAKANYQTWLKDTVGLSCHNDQFVVGVPSVFVSEWLERQLKPLVKKTLTRIAGHPLEVQFQLYHETEGGAPPPPSHHRWEQLKLNPKYTFASFVVGNSNAMAHAAALRVTKEPGTVYNPLFIHGGVGLGKTHLLHAIGHMVLKTTPLVLYVTAEQFTNELISGIKDGRTEEFRNKYRGIDVLLIDDVQFVAGKERTQEALFHTFNDLHNANHQIVLSSDRSPKSLSLLEERLRSRFAWGLIADIQPPEFETRVAILQAKAAAEQQTEVSPDVLYFIARRIQDNIRELEEALNRVIARARLTHSPLTPELAAQALTEIAPIDSKRNLTLKLIIDTVAEYYKLDYDTLCGRRRDRPIVLARQLAIYLLREETQYSWSEIGRELGGKAHSTILHDYRKIAAEVDASYTLRREIQAIKEHLYSKLSRDL